MDYTNNIPELAHVAQFLCLLEMASWFWHVCNVHRSSKLLHFNTVNKRVQFAVYNWDI